MHYEILDEERQKVLPLLKRWKEKYYLAGGTSLALQIGHRDSIDFDFFTKDDIDTQNLFTEIEENFKGAKIEKLQEEENTLTVLIGSHVQLSFMKYSYLLLNDLIQEEYIALASKEDIGCMKLSAISGRSSNKDYIDLYFLLQDMSLEELLEGAEKKFPNFNRNVALKSLVYFDDIQEEEIKFQKNKEVSFKEIQEFLRKTVFRARLK